MANTDYCILCDSKDYTLLPVKLRFDEPGEVVECKSCRLVRLKGAALMAEETEEFYKEDYAKKYFENEKNKVNTLYETFFPLQKRRYDSVKEFIDSSSKVVEIGSGAGYFLGTIRPHVEEIVGVELNRIHATFANEIKNIKTYTDDFRKLPYPENYFDMVAMFQVLEHMVDPVQELTDMKSLLKPGGHIVIEIPNPENPLVSLYKNEAFINFWHQKPHLYYYSRETLTKIVEKAGLEIVKMLTVQEVGFINHINWILTGQPMKNRLLCVEDTKLFLETIQDNDELSRAIAKMYDSFNQQYRALLEQHHHGDEIICVCRTA